MAEEAVAAAATAEQAPPDFSAWRQQREKPKQEAEPSETDSKKEPEKAREESEPSEEEQEQEKEPEKKESKKRSAIEDAIYQRRRAQEAERERDELRRRLEERGDKTSAKEEARASETAVAKDRPKPPKMADFDTLEKYEAARDTYQEELTEWRLKQWEAERRQAETKQRDVEEKQRVESTWRERAAKFATEHEDFESVVANPELRVTAGMAHAIQQSEVGPHVAYWLGQHPAEAARIAALNPVRQAAEIGKLEARFEKAPEKEKRESSAPEPIKPAGQRAAAAQETADGMDFGKWRRLRERQLAGRRI
jgi:hypothetical protein